jgi:hypothetical protein
MKKSCVLPIKMDRKGAIEKAHAAGAVTPKAMYKQSGSA